MKAAALAALLAMSAAGSAASRAVAEPLLSAPEQSTPLPSPAPAPAQVAIQAPARPQTDAFDCWLLDQNRLEQASGRGLCGDAFARAPETAAPKIATSETAALPEAPPPPPPSAVTPARKPKAPERHVRSAGRSISNSETQAQASSSARISRGESGDFFSNFQRDFRSLTNLLGGGSPSPRRGDGDTASHMSHNH